MKLYEYEGKALLAKAGIPVPKGDVVAGPTEAVAVAAELSYPVVLKSQVLRGGRGKAGGIRFAADGEALVREAEALLTLSIGGERVEKLLIEERLTVARELYAGITLDPLTLLPQLMISPSGGMDIETVAHSTPGKLYRLPLDPLDLPGLPQVIDLVLMAGLQGEEMLRVAGTVQNLIRAYFRYEAITVEINPLIIDAQGRVLAADAKLEIDDSALVRVKETAATLRIVLKTPGVEGILINLFGGINNCESMAKGIAQVLDALHPPQAIVVKMRGHSQDEGWAILEARQIPIVKFGTTEEAVLLLMAKLKERGVRGSGHTG